MKSFVDLDSTFAGQPARLGALLQRVDVSCGREELFQDQLPELLASLAESARVASIRASNAIEGVEVEQGRAERLAGGARFRNRNEREFAGYRDAIDELMRTGPEPVSVPLILHLHRRVFAHVDGAGGRFKRDDNEIVSWEGGSKHVVFRPVSARETPSYTEELVARYLEAQADAVAHPLVLLAAFVLDLLAIHPVADGNGRLARLVTTSELLQLGYGVARYVSVEQQVYETKNAYYASLFESQRGWHDGQHTIWPWTEYFVRTLAATYERFEDRVAAARGSAAGSKQERVRRYVLEQAPSRFRIADVRRGVPGTSDQTIRLVLNELKVAGRVRPEGTGRGAGWARVESG
ncbi:MAG TPA: Fic family protein [Solirubrobacteraceae bacterium]|jgi:Fic family protein|nr:Fic family protein [Solirubrobacteraceae bacterium]